MMKSWIFWSVVFLTTYLFNKNRKNSLYNYIDVEGFRMTVKKRREGILAIIRRSRRLR